MTKMKGYVHVLVMRIVYSSCDGPVLARMLFWRDTFFLSTAFQWMGLSFFATEPGLLHPIFMSRFRRKLFLQTQVHSGSAYLFGRRISHEHWSASASSAARGAKGEYSYPICFSSRIMATLCGS